MRNLKVTMAFRGTRYHGFQRQPNALTVQEVVEEALSKLLNEPVAIQGCSRTDTGVHAKEFCFSMQTEKPIPPRNFIRGSCGYLPEDISILSVEDMPPEFHARFSCQAKQYMYRIHNSESKNPFTTDLELHYRRKLDVELMREAAQHFVGTHDFAALCTNCTEKQTTIRTIYDITIEKEGDTVILLVKGNGFLYNMVRILVGTLLSVNEGRIPVSELEALLESRDRTRAGITAQAHGLSLYRVFY
ncbi:tRNA pseudouridine(38-40) synthase TruA [Ruminococcus sp.]|uniref:tRNA pseudouridine(38-40) synthase TruA n=1 Tax=Ruminococcus sp. TaxID=41978 RepID=UPI0025FEB861|nr:tRNA pseudouridine(38-40) synthase TruA [Ruminococcus sp.]